MYQALHGAALDVRVDCTNREMGGAHVSFQDMLDIMEHSVFCLALAGDSPSTRRLSEIFLAGACWSLWRMIVTPFLRACRLRACMQGGKLGLFADGCENATADGAQSCACQHLPGQCHETDQVCRLS